MRPAICIAMSSLFLATAAQADESRVSRPNTCFYVNELNGWRAPDAKTINLRVGASRYYRLELSSECQELLWPNAHLIMNVSGPDTICSAIDWDLKVGGDMHDIPEACIVKSMTELSPADVAGIPKKFKP